MTQEEFNALIETWIANNGGRYNMAHTGADIDAAVSTVKGKAAQWDKASQFPNQPITRAEYDALSDEDKQKDIVYDIVDDFTSESVVLQNEQSIYSATDEVVVGRWIDGKPIYKSVIVGKNIASGSPLLPENNVDRLIELSGCLITAAGNEVPLPYTLNSENLVDGIKSAGTNNIALTVKGYTSNTIYAVFRYTKTTDEPTIAIPTTAEMTAAYEEGVQSA